MPVSEGSEKSKVKRPQVLKGFRDHTPSQMIVRQEIIRRFRAIFERHGFEAIETPALEYLEVLRGKAGENEKLMYHFVDEGDRAVGLRYDLTVPLARFIAVHENDIVLPFKRYHIAPVWRAEKPQRGRFREFWQCDADIVGSPSMAADAEIVSILAESLVAVGLPNFQIQISHRRLLEGIALAAGVPESRSGTIYRSVDKLAKIGASAVKAEMVADGISTEAAESVLSVVTLDETGDELIFELRDRLSAVPTAMAALDQLAELLELIGAFGVDASRYRLDVSLARGLDYYTGPVYEATVEEPKVGSMAGAGRYDGLIGSMIGRSMPATGMSLGLERIIEVVEQFGLIEMPASVAQVFVAAVPETVGSAAAIATQLRRAGFNVDLSLQSNRSLGDQLKYAGRKQIPLAVIAGAAELEHEEVSLKDLVSGQQIPVGLNDLAGALEAHFGRTDA